MPGVKGDHANEVFVKSLNTFVPLKLRESTDKQLYRRV